jgi:hypothetical protein
MAGLGLPTGRVTSGTTPKMPAYAARRAPDGRIAGVGLPAGAKLIASGSGFGTGQVPASDPYGQLPATAANYHPYEAPAQTGIPATDGSGVVAPGDGIGSAMRYDEATGYQGNDPSHPVNFATGAGMGVEPTNMKGVYRDGNAFSNVPGAPSVAPVRAPLPLAQTRLKAPVSVPVAPSPLAGAAINKAYEPDPFNGAAIQTQYEPVAQQAGNFIGSSIGDAWGAGPGVPTAPDAPTFTPSKWAGTHAVEDAYNSGLGQYGVKGVSDYWTAKGLPSARPIPAIYDPADWWIARQLGAFGRGVAGS